MTAADKDRVKTHRFKAEIKQLLDILIHSVYTSKDVFIRELISNATDALEKVRFCQVQGQPIASPDLPLEIRISTRSEEEQKILTIADTGIGMTADEVRANIGTIAHSGATAFLEQLKKSKQDGADGTADLSLIGRFGVGFYSVFMAAEKVVLTTRAADPDGHPVRWVCTGVGSYTLETLEEDVPRGTQIEVYLKKDEERFGSEETVKQTIKRYSNFVPFPVFVGDDRVNQTRALWREQPSQVNEEQYTEFFKLIGHEDDAPRLKLHFSVDAPLQFSALLFVPRSNPELLGFGERESHLQLYAKRVLIDGEAKGLLPPYLRFVRGVVESEDLPLNVSRESLQENRLVAKIRDTLTRRLLDSLLELAQDQPEEYTAFWRTFCANLKEGYNDFAYRDKLQDLLRFNSSRHENAEDLISLAQYVEAMPEGQQAIYYLTGASREALLRDPRLELFRKQKIEVLYLYEAADEFVLGNLMMYNEKRLVSADQVKPDDLKGIGTADESDQATAAEQPAAEDISLLVARFKELLGDRVVDVRTSERLVDSPACLVSEDGQLSAHLDRMMRMMNKVSDLPKRVLELNPQHPLVANLTRICQRDTREPFLELACEQIFEGAMLMDGYLADPHKLVERMNNILADAAAAKTE